MSMCRDTCMYSTSLGIRTLNICFSLQIDPLPPPHTHCYHMIHAVIQVEIAKKKKNYFPRTTFSKSKEVPMIE